MSVYGKIQTQFRDMDSLIAALVELGYTKEMIELHTESTHLYGYHGDRRAEKANIVIRRFHIGLSSNDIGFLRESDGSYTAIVSKFDQGILGADWMNRLKRSYAKIAAVSVLSKRGYRVTSEVKTGDSLRVVMSRAR